MKKQNSKHSFHKKKFQKRLKIFLFFSQYIIIIYHNDLLQYLPLFLAKVFHNCQKNLDKKFYNQHSYLNPLFGDCLSLQYLRHFGWKILVGKFIDS